MRRSQWAGLLLVAAMAAGCSDDVQVVAPTDAPGMDARLACTVSDDAATKTRTASRGCTNAELSAPAGWTVRLDGLGAASAFVQGPISLPYDGYLTTTAKIELSGIIDSTRLTSITDGIQTVSFDITMAKRSVPWSWAWWGLPPYTETSTPHVLFTQRVDNLTMTLSQPASVFGFELEPNLSGVFSIIAAFFSGSTLVETIVKDVAGYEGARVFGVQADLPITRVEITAVPYPISPSGFAIAQIRYQLPQAGGPSNDVETVHDELPGLDLPAGVVNSLQSKLQSALDALTAGDTATACASLGAFVNEVRAQRGKKIPAATADALIADVVAIMSALGCPA